MSRRIIQDIISRVTSSPPHEAKGEKKIWRFVFFVGIGSILVLILFFFFSSSFSRVSVRVETTKKEISLDELIFLNKDGAGGGVKYDLMKLEDTELSNVPVTGSKIVSRLATGNVTIYNSYSSTAQKLLIGTRLQTKDGKIYKINNAVIVPGTSILGGKIVPGSVSVPVKASLAGVAYNIPASDFTIPGFQGGPKYEKFYAKSNKEITGGFSGEIKISSPADLQKARSSLEEVIKQKLTKNAFAQVPKNFILYEDLTFLNFKDNTIDNSSLVENAGEAGSLKVTGTLNVIIIDSNNLRNFIVNKKIPDLNKDAKIIISGLDKLTLKILNKEKVNINVLDTIIVRGTGKLPAVWDFDENILKTKLLGIKKSKYQDVFKEFPVIEKASADFSPWWAIYFPTDPTRIEINKGF